MNSKAIYLRKAEKAMLYSRLTVFLCLLFIALFPVLPALAQVAVDTNESWSIAGTAGWSNTEAQATLSNPGGYLNMRFAAQSQPMSSSDIAKRSISGTVVTNISFRFMAVNTLPSSIQLYFHSSKSGRSWHVNLEPPAVGEWGEYDVPVNKSIRWVSVLGGNAEIFNADIDWVDWVGVYVRRNGDACMQDYAIDDFRVMGVTVDAAAGGAHSIPADWLVANGFSTNDAAIAMVDTDGDGMINWAEYRAGTDPNSADSKLKLGIESNSKPDKTKGIILKWASAPGVSYRVRRATNLMDGFTVISSGIAATLPENSFEDAAATGEGPYFYKIEVE